MSFSLCCMKPRRPKLTIASALCSAPAVVLAVWAFSLYYFGPTSKARSEDVLGLALISLWTSPLAIAGIALALLARGFRCPCTAAGLVPFVCWGAIIINEGGLW